MIGRRFISVATLLTLPAAFLSAASLSGGTTCQVPGQYVATDGVPDTCSAQTGNFLAGTGVLAGANLTQTFSSNVSNLYSPLSDFYFSLDVAANVQNQPLVSTLPASAGASIYDTFFITTAGPVRPGYIDISLSFDESGFGGSSGIASNYFGLESSSFPLQCLGGCTIPVLLGTTFEVELSAATNLTSIDDGSQYAQSGISTTGSIFFLEQDQTTPVSFVTDITPEPTYVFLMVFGLLLVATLRFKRLLHPQT